ncbi:cobaltochelatase subunit CobN [Pseudomaricurvus sp.]|uniref:cobaltochelatase subunit CobN n=1 Tax=Pseudomaricurvus sp. TaxID=2004510 RepID=UPI003F6CACE5
MFGLVSNLKKSGRWLQTGRCVGVLVLMLSMASSVQAGTVLGVVSSSNSADVLTGAHAFLNANPQHQLILRTTDQFSELPEPERQALIKQADIVFAGGVFGDASTLLNGYLEDDRLIPSFVAVHSDRRLVSSSRLNSKPLLQGADLDQLMQDPPLEQDADLLAWSQQQLNDNPKYRDWLTTKLFWADRNGSNLDGIFRHLLASTGENLSVPAPELRKPLRVFLDEQPVEIIGNKLQLNKLNIDDDKRWVVILDYEHGDRPGERELMEDLCEQQATSNRYCLRVLAKWGEASVEAVDILAQYRDRIGVVVSLQNFVIGGGEGRAEVTQSLEALNVPTLKAIRLTDSTEDEWRLSEEGLRWDSVHYRIAMPELQGVSQPLVVAAMTPPSLDKATGLKVTLSRLIESQVTLLNQRVDRWLALQEKSNADKKVGIIYYNHPPGRHNIGADNLNVPASLFHILQEMKAAGYNTGELPATEEALLDLLQEKGVNLPEDRQVLKSMSAKVQTVSPAQYQQWFDTLPAALQREMVAGPLGYLHEMLQRAVHLENKDIARHLTARVVKDLRHAIEGADHPSRERVMNLLQQLEDSYGESVDGSAQNKAVDWSKAEELVSAISDSGVEGLRGWGAIPGKVMVYDNQLLIPGIQFGNVFVGPQPPRGWELNEELLHANLSFPPPHQYMAFYQWLRNGFQADALVHLGRHSTYEFLPRHRVGLSDEDYSQALLGDLPSVYPYIVDGVGEGIQAKRRGLAVMIDHLTPPLDSTELYDQLLELRHLVESYEAAPEAAGAMRQRAITAMKSMVDDLKLRDELLASMSGELEVRGITDFDQVDDELLVHEIGHYLTHLQEDFMPLGLHVFGQDWTDKAIDTMLTSMAQGDEVGAGWESMLSASPKAEMDGLLKGLSGQFIAPGKGNDPIRTPEALPTGRNFYALDGSLIPSRLGYDVGLELAAKARQETVSNVSAVVDGDVDGNVDGKKVNGHAQIPESDAIVLWASDVVRDEGAMIAFGFDMLGVKPMWSSRGIVKDLERLDVTGMMENGQPRQRHDTVFTTSGLFRDLYGAHLVLLEKAVLMALDASSDLIREQYPALTYALNGALEPLGNQQNPGSESLNINLVAARWVEDARNALKQGMPAVMAGKQSAYRVFGDAPGTYGAGVNRLAERSGSWKERSELADTYMSRMGHAYGLNLQGEPMQDVFKQRLNTVGHTYLGRSSNLYGLLDNNDAFDYLGGLSLAVETVKGQPPENFILFHKDANSLSMEPLEVALLAELRGQFLNPQWLKPLMDEGYAGARTMGSEFLEYLWGWLVTNPGFVKSWVWDEVKSVYIDDKLNIGLNEFLEQNHNAHVKANMLAIMLVAAQKGFWEASDETLKQVAGSFTELVLENGLPGSGHTTQNHPMYDFIKPYVDEEQYKNLQKLLSETTVDSSVAAAPSVVAEINLSDANAVQQAESQTASDQDAAHKDNAENQSQDSESQTPPYYWVALLLAVLLIAGWVRGSRAPASQRNKD